MVLVALMNFFLDQYVSEPCSLLGAETLATLFAPLVSIKFDEGQSLRMSYRSQEKKWG
jgi:hypothetical protein